MSMEEEQEYTPRVSSKKAKDGNLVNYQSEPDLKKQSSCRGLQGKE